MPPAIFLLKFSNGKEKGRSIFGFGIIGSIYKIIIEPELPVTNNGRNRNIRLVMNIEVKKD